MKLKNKKTGGIKECPMIRVSIGVCDLMHYEFPNSLAELNEEWEDYKPKAPLIKDEEKLDTVKSFFTLLGITKEIYYQSINNCFYHTDDDGITYGIDFDNDKDIGNIGTDRAYTIDELCGEKE